MLRFTSPIVSFVVLIIFALFFILFTQRLGFTIVLLILLGVIIAVTIIDKFVNTYTSIISSKIEFCENNILYFVKSLKCEDKVYRINKISDYSQNGDELTIYGDIDVICNGSFVKSTSMCMIEGILSDEVVDLIFDFQETH